jgi:hypothetical protein
VGFTQVEVIPIHELDLHSATLTRESRAAAVVMPAAGPGGGRSAAVPGMTARLLGALEPPAGTSASAVVGQRVSDAGADVLTQVVEAMGGAAALRGVRTMVAEAETTLRMEHDVVPSRTRTYVRYPDHFRVEAQVDGADVVQVFSAGRAWSEDPGGVHELPPSVTDEFAQSVRRDLVAVLAGALEGRLSVRALPEEGRDGRVFRVIEVTGPQLPPVRLFIGADGLVALQAFTAPGPGGRSVALEEVYSDYRPVDGLLLPFAAELRRDGRAMLSRTLTSVTLNDPLDDELFRRPQG